MNYINNEMLAAMREGGVEFYVIMDEELEQLLAFEVSRNALVFDHDGEVMNLYNPAGDVVFTINPDNHEDFNDEALAFIMDSEWGSDGFSKRVTEEANRAIEVFMTAETGVMVVVEVDND